MTASTISLAPGLDALCNPYRLDGRVSTHPVQLRGWASMNCYLLTQDGAALLLDTGLTVHQDAILAQLGQLLSERPALSVFPLRYGEFGGICNARSIVERFGAERLHGQLFGEPWEWLDFGPGSQHPDRAGAAALRRVASVPVQAAVPVAVDPAGRRTVQTFAAPIRLLPMPWAYDDVTRTLFTGDVFGWTIRSDAAGPWTAEAGDVPSAEFVYEALVHSRYWWMAGGSLGRMRSDLEAVWDRYEVDTIAPGFGAVLHGRDVVQRSVAVLDEAIALAQRRPSIGIEVGTWRLEDRR